MFEKWFAVCQGLRHIAKKWFTVCLRSWHMANHFFAVCRRSWHTANLVTDTYSPSHFDTPHTRTTHARAAPPPSAAPRRRPVASSWSSSWRRPVPSLPGAAHRARPSLSRRFLASLLRPTRPRRPRETESGWWKATGIFLSICSRQISAATLDQQKPSLREDEMHNGAASGDLALGHEPCRPLVRRLHCPVHELMTFGNRD